MNATEIAPQRLTARPPDLLPLVTFTSLLLSLGAGVITFSQTLAHRLGYHPALGQPVGQAPFRIIAYAIVVLLLRGNQADRRGRASQNHSTSVERRPRRLSSLISQALSFDDADAYAAGEVGFFARARVQATMPHSDPKTNEFVRHNGHYSLSILAPKGVGLPYGRYPRLVLAYLNTEAVKRKTRHIELDHHFSQFCSALGIPLPTGPRGSLPQLRAEKDALGGLAAGLIGQASQGPGDPAIHLLRRDLAEALLELEHSRGDRAGGGQGEFRMVAGDLGQHLPIPPKDFTGLNGLCGHRVARRLDQREPSEDLARAAEPDHHLGAVLSRVGQANGAASHQEEGVRRVSLMEDFLPASHSLPEGGGDE